MSRFLITTADERSWKFDRPVLFLGEWCCLYERKKIWGNLDAEVAKPYGLKSAQKKYNISYVEMVSHQILSELSEALNIFHKTKHSSRYWEIVLGHWLKRYVAAIFYRYFTLEQTLNEYDISATNVFELTDYSLATTDSVTFYYANNDDIWNHVIYSKILNFINFLGSEKIEMSSSDLLLKSSGFTLTSQNCKLTRKAIIKRYFLNAFKGLIKFSRNNDAYIVNSLLPLKEEFKLQLSLGQCPQLWHSPILKKVAPIPEQRQQFSISSENYHGFEKLVRFLLPQIIPSCYLEGYTALIQQVQSLPWPTKPKFIFTSNNFDADEIFKMWAASKVEENIPYFTGQHGNNYGSHIYLGNQHWPEHTTSDKFFTWGWTNNNSHNIPAFNFKTAGLKNKSKTSGDRLLLIELCLENYLYPWDSYFEFGIYQEEQFRFVEALPEPIWQKLIIRFHLEYKNFPWSDEQRWKDRSPHIRIDTGTTKIWKLIAQSRLVVHSYDSTGVLETLALNVPTLCFWQGGFDHLLPPAKPYYQLLRDAGIIANSPEEATKLVTLYWDNISEWWKSKKVQDAREIFCERYARTEKHPIRALKKLLTQNLRQE